MLPPLAHQKDGCGPRCGKWFFWIAFCVGLEIKNMNGRSRQKKKSFKNFYFEELPHWAGSWAYWMTCPQTWTVCSGRPHEHPHTLRIEIRSVWNVKPVKPMAELSTLLFRLESSHGLISAMGLRFQSHFYLGDAQDDRSSMPVPLELTFDRFEMWSPLSPWRS
jgi:hypothetical protein